MEIKEIVYVGGKLPRITSPLGFHYLLGGNGVFIHAKNDFFEVIKALTEQSERGVSIR